MKTAIAGGTRLKVCAHCGGTGMCRRAEYQNDHFHHWLECTECGRGVPAVVGELLEAAEHGPRCSACGGTGHVD